MTADAYETILRDRQRELHRRLNKIEADFEQPRNPDDDDRAQERNNDEVLDELGQVGQEELKAIGAALDRIAAGTFGTCTRCGPIAIVSRIAPRIAIGLLRFTIATAISLPDSRTATSSRPWPSMHYGRSTACSASCRARRAPPSCTTAWTA